MKYGNVGYTGVYKRKKGFCNGSGMGMPSIVYIRMNFLITMA
jgi:purine-nucleoside phosphorylase